MLQVRKQVFKLE